MSLHFDNSAHQYVGCSAGTIGAAGTGAYTIVTLTRMSGNSTPVSLWSGSLTGTLVREISADTNSWIGAGETAPGFGSFSTSTWYLTGQSKAAGTNTYRWHIWPYAADGSGLKSHSNGTATHADGSAIAGIRIGDGDDKGNGDVALVAIWKRVLSDGDFDYLCTNTAQAFMNLPSGAPDALLLCNGRAPGDVVDITGNGANATTTVGTGITIGSDPPSFDYSIDVNVSVDAVGPSSSGQNITPATGTPSISWSHTCSGSQRLLIVGVCANSKDGVTTITSLTLSATYNGVAMTSIGIQKGNNTNVGFVQMFYLVAPSIGSHTVSVTTANNTNNATIGLVAGSVSFNGVDQTTPYENVATAAGSTGNPTLTTTSALNNMVIDIMGLGSGSISLAAGGQTIQWGNAVRNGDFGTVAIGGQSTKPGAPSVTTEYVGNGDSWGMVGASIRAAGGPGTQSMNNWGFITSYSGDYTVSIPTQTLKLTTQPGDCLVVYGGSENEVGTLTTPTGNGVAFTLQQSVTATNNATAYLWTGVDTVGGTNWTLTCTSPGQYWAFSCLVFRGCTGFGNSAVANTSGTPSLTLNTAASNSFIVAFNTDWNAVDGTLTGATPRVWDTINGITPTNANGLERDFAYIPNLYTVYGAYYSNAGAAGSKTVGLSAPSGQQYSLIAQEIYAATPQPMLVGWFYM